MNTRKQTIVNNVSCLTNNKKLHTKQVIEMFLGEIIDELGKGNRIEFRGFGVLEVVKRKSKKARNPRTNEEMIVPAHKVVKFKMGKKMKNQLL